jgi:hypothetical protein
MEGNMRGEVVVFKDFRGKYLEMVLRQDCSGLIFVHSKERFSAHMAGNPHLEPIGVPVEDVFKRDEGTGTLVPIALSRKDDHSVYKHSVSSA